MSADPPNGPSTKSPLWVSWATFVLAISSIVLVIYLTRDIFAPLLAAVALAYIFEPLVQRLVRRGQPRARAATLVFCAVSAILFGLLAVLILQGVALVRSLSLETDSDMVLEGFNQSIAWIKERSRSLPWGIGDQVTGLLDSENIQAVVAGIPKILLQILSGVITSVTNLSMIVLLPIYLFFIMCDLDKFWAWILAHLPARNRERSLRVLGDIHQGMSAFLRGRMIIALLKGLFIAIGLFVCGTEVALLIGLGSGFLSILPFIGAFLGYVIAMAVTLSQDFTPYAAIFVSSVYLAAEAVEGFALTPWVMKEGIGLHPLLVLFSVIFWGSILGLFGALLAIPLTLVIAILMREYVLPSVNRLATREVT